MPVRARRRQTPRGGALAVFLFGAIGLLALGPIFWKYSLAILNPFPSSASLEPVAAEQLLRSHTIISLGGPHRGGTTLLWRLIGLHASVSSFGTRLPTDFSEGSFLQTVLPTFGVGDDDATCMRSGRVKRMAGVGRYALSPAAHLTEDSPLNTAANRRKLLAQWSVHWDLTKRHLLEKTPTNMLTSRLLQSLLGPKITFLFITRHPLAVALAERRQASCGSALIVCTTCRLASPAIDSHAILRARAHARTNTGADTRTQTHMSVLVSSPHRHKITHIHADAPRPRLVQAPARVCANAHAQGLPHAAIVQTCVQTHCVHDTPSLLRQAGPELAYTLQSS